MLNIGFASFVYFLQEMMMIGTRDRGDTTFLISFTFMIAYMNGMLDIYTYAVSDTNCFDHETSELLQYPNFLPLS